MVTKTELGDLTHSRDYECKLYSKKISPEIFDPIGSLVEEREMIILGYRPASEESIDRSWMESIFPNNIEGVQIKLREAFSQYCGEDWCGADMREEILEDFSEGGLVPSKESLEAFIKYGYIPFLEITGIIFDREMDCVIVYLRTDIDYNLDEHGIAVKMTRQAVEFGYGADFMRDDEC